jgi:hypothetical protein
MSEIDTPAETFQKREEKKTRKSRKVPLNNVIEEVKEVKDNEPVEIVQEMSYHKAKSLLPKRAMSEKQQANIKKLVAMNKERRDNARKDKEKEDMKQELLKKIEEEQKLKESRKLVKIKTIVKPKANYKKKVKKFELVDNPDYDPYTETSGCETSRPYIKTRRVSDETDTGAESTDTQIIKKAEKKIKKIDEIVQPPPQPYNRVNDIMKHLF